MSRRTKNAYISALRFVNDNLIQLTGSIIIDFEAAMRNSLKVVSPNIIILGCLFHHDQALLRKAVSLPELYKLIRTNKDAYFEFRKYQSLALLPSYMIKDAFVALLRETLQKYPEFAPFLDYYKKEWIGKVKPIHYSVFNKDIRTTGAAEAYNCRINHLFRTHGSMFQFAESVQREEAVKADEFFRDVSGVPQIDRRKAFYKKRSTLISKYSSLLESRQITCNHFLNVMANINNQIISEEKHMVVDDINVQMAITSDLIEGEDLPDEPPVNNNAEVIAQSMELACGEQKESKRTSGRKKAKSVDNEPKKKPLRTNKKRTEEASAATSTKGLNGRNKRKLPGM